MHTKFWSENLKGREHLEVFDEDGKIKFLGTQLRRWGLDASNSGLGPV
jgi:hypothetical protein